MLACAKRRWVEMQGYAGLSDEQLREVAPWSRLAPAVCSVWVGVATALGSAPGVLALVPLAVLGALLPWHPFDLLYNYGLRHLTRTGPLPRHGLPRRFACSIATLWLLATGWAFATGQTGLGKLLGYSMTAAAAVPALTDFCIPSFFFRLARRERI